MESLEVKIYYEDTDCGGVVYHANYLRYFERARTEYFARRGISTREYRDQGITFVVVRAELDYQASAVYGDLLSIESSVDQIKRVSFVFHHTVRRKGESIILVQGKIKLACLNRVGRLTRFPEPILSVLNG